MIDELFTNAHYVSLRADISINKLKQSFAEINPLKKSCRYEK